MAEDQEQQQEDDREGQRYHLLQSFAGALQVLILTGPVNRVAFR
jgi:hypothetical protein